MLVPRVFESDLNNLLSNVASVPGLTLRSIVLVYLAQPVSK
jgi:hypothetical protein